MNKEVVWNYLSSDEGFQAWFPDIKIGEFEEGGHLCFVAHNENIKMPILALVENAMLNVEWGMGTASFSLNEQDGITHLSFHEELPMHFNHRYLDIAGWEITIVILKDHIEGRKTDIDFSKVKELEVNYQKQIEK